MSGHDHNHHDEEKGVSRRKVLECMTWAGTGVLWTVTGGVVEPLPGQRLEVSLARRRTRDGEIVLIFNEAWSPTKARLRFTKGGGPLVVWDPFTGSRIPLRESVKTGEEISVELEAAGVRILTLANPS